MSSIASSNRKVVLVAEDDIFTREDPIEVLERSGFEALRASHADEALAVLAESSRIDAMFTDVNMPRGSIDGLRLARQVSAGFSGIAVVVTSGRIAPAGDPPEGVGFPSKPYRPESVARILDAAIDAERRQQAWRNRISGPGVRAPT